MCKADVSIDLDAELFELPIFKLGLLFQFNAQIYVVVFFNIDRGTVSSRLVMTWVYFCFT